MRSRVQKKKKNKRKKKQQKTAVRITEKIN